VNCSILRQAAQKLIQRKPGIFFALTGSHVFCVGSDLSPPEVSSSVEVRLPFSDGENERLACKMLIATPMNPQERSSGGLNKGETAGNQRSTKSSFPQEGKRRRPCKASRRLDEGRRAASNSLTRTRSLILAAVRVWELKQGNRR
jgi:hypothetical protein